MPKNEKALKNNTKTFKISFYYWNGPKKARMAEKYNIRFWFNRIFSRFWYCWFCFWHYCCGLVISLLPLHSSPYLFGQPSFLRSNLSAPCGVVLRHSSIRVLQRSECACALLLSLIALQLAHPIVPLELLVCPLSTFHPSSSTVLQSRCWRLLCGICLEVPISGFHELWTHHLHSQTKFLRCCFASQAKPRFNIWGSSCSSDMWWLVLPAPFLQTRQTLVSASYRAVSQMASFRHDLSGCIQRAPPTIVWQASRRWVVLASCFRYGTWLFWYVHAVTLPRSQWAHSTLSLLSLRLPW